jgi:hypothetical protein
MLRPGGPSKRGREDVVRVKEISDEAIRTFFSSRRLVRFTLDVRFDETLQTGRN